MSFCSIILLFQFIIIILLVLKINKKNQDINKDINKDTNNLKEILEIDDKFIEQNNLIISEHLLNKANNDHKKGGKTLKEIKADREARDRANL